MLKPDAALRKDRTNAYSAMEHRHFATVAAIIASINMFDSERAFIAEHFADELAKTNPRFARKRFLAACRG